MDQQELINAYLDRKLSPEDQKLFENLIEDNPEYKAELEQQKKLKAAITLSERESLRGFLEEVDSLPPQTSLKSWLFSGAIAFLLVLAGYFLWITLSMSPGQKLFAKYFESYPNQVPPSLLENDEFGLKSEAFQAYDQGDFQKAAALFEQVKTQPDSDFALLYLGICQLELGRPEKAIPVLSLIPVNSKTASKEVASWFEALGYFKLNMLDKGKKSLQITAANTNPFQAQARNILESLE